MLRTEIDEDILSAKGNKNYTYMRNHKYFKDGVLLPPGDSLYNVEEGAASINQYGDKIFKNAQKQNKDVFNEIAALKSYNVSGKIERNLKNKVIKEVNTHVQR